MITTLFIRQPFRSADVRFLEQKPSSANGQPPRIQGFKMKVSGTIEVLLNPLDG